MREAVIVSGAHRLTYQDLADRIARLASLLAAKGVKPGDTVAVMDWDSHRYLECFFAIPMMGAVLHTINVRLSPEQILYTINHAEDDVIIVHEDFLPVIAQIQGGFERPCRFVLIRETADALRHRVVRRAARVDRVLHAPPRRGCVV